jgi:hypothetical protein
MREIIVAAAYPMDLLGRIDEEKEQGERPCCSRGCR